MGTMREELAAALAATGEKNASENRDRNTSMRAVANDIADAIEKGARIQFKASATCFQINSIPMEQRVPGDIYLATDAGVLVGEVPLAVQPNTAVLWDGRSWKTFLSLNLDNYYNKEQIDGAVNVLRLLIDGHATRTDNPHNVTAEQVGAISATALDEAISLHNMSEDAHEDIRQIIDGKADKVSNATNGHLAGLDGNGNLTDSGISSSDIANKVFIAIEYTTPFNDILAAYNAGKVILLASQDGSRYYYLMNYRDNHAGARPRFTFYYKDLDFESTNLRDTYTYVESNNEWRNISVLSAERSHASASTAYGVGSENAYGHVQLTGSVTQNSSKAVKSGAVYDALQDIRGDMEGKQDVLASNSLAFIYKSTSGDVAKFLNEQGNFVSVDGIPVQKIVVGQTLQRRRDCLYSYSSVNELFVMTNWVERRVSGAAYEMILRSINTEISVYIKVIITEQFVVYNVNSINGFLYNKWNLEDSINTDVVLVTYKQGVIFPSFNALINAVHNRRDVLLVAYTADGEEQEYYRLQWWKLYSGDNVYDFHFAMYDEIAHSFKSYRFSYNGGSLINAVGEVFSPISSVGTNNIGNGAVTNAKLANYAVTSEKLEAGAVISGKIATGAVGTTKLADGAVTNDKVATSAIIRDKIAFGAVSADKQACGYFDWTIDTHYNGGSRNYIDLSGSNGGSGNDGSLNSLHTIFTNDTTIRFSDVMVRFNVTYGTSSNTAYVYCNVESLPKFTLFKLKAVAVGHSIIIRFRTNATTEALAAAYVNENVYYNTTRDYTIDAGAQEDICFFRGNDSGSNCRLYLISNWT